ncbi:peroxidase 3-like [Tripterygium wilfordii]|uniref:peroxidase 3-like n=1 Tax=Tripterygium wilfordii TaxID=458696 RepID=UPI0018F851DF|nr:peroxidase 3-like [Tripterygium wilfordii]
MGGVSLLAVIILCVLGYLGSTNAQLQMGFYAKSCPEAEKIVFDSVIKHIHDSPSLAPSLLRLHFHDCFVRGCDASVLLKSKRKKAERNAPPNLTLRGFSFIDSVKSKLEAECPGIVSCADIIALAAMDTVAAIGGPFCRIPTGRRDGKTSRKSEASKNIPSPTSNFTNLEKLFANQGLDSKDLVVLSGAHTIGVSHCTSFSYRLYNFTGKGDQDPALDGEYAKILKAKKCKTPKDNTTLVEMDPGSPYAFDLNYYKLLLTKKGLFQSDSALTTNSTALFWIKHILHGSLRRFYFEFAMAMKKMGRINVKTGSSGQIRKKCGLVNK